MPRQAQGTHNAHACPTLLSHRACFQAQCALPTSSAKPACKRLHMLLQRPCLYRYATMLSLHILPHCCQQLCVVYNPVLLQRRPSHPLCQADSDPDGADSDGPPRLLRLDFLASLRDGEDSPVPGLTAADLVEALESGYANDADTYEAVGRVRVRVWMPLH